MKTLSKGFYLGSVAGGIGSAILLMIVGYAMILSGEDESGVVIVGIAMIPMLYGAIVFMTLVYKMWASIQDGHARTSPGKAIGFMFIPFFNFYWAFQAIWGFSKDYNSYIDRHSVSAAKLPEGLFLTYNILTLTGWIPFLGVLLVAANFVIMIMMVSKICDGVNALPQTP